MDEMLVGFTGAISLFTLILFLNRTLKIHLQSILERSPSEEQVCFFEDPEPEIHWDELRDFFTQGDQIREQMNLSEHSSGRTYIRG